MPSYRPTLFRESDGKFAAVSLDKLNYPLSSHQAQASQTIIKPTNILFESDKSQSAPIDILN